MIGHKGEQAVTVRALRGAAPYIHMYKGKVFVIKTGGGAFRDPATMRAFVEQVAILHHLGIRVVLVHGGGPQVDEITAKLGVETRMVQGRRVTDASAIDATSMVLNGLINTQLLALCRGFGIAAIGISGVDGGLVQAHRRPPVTLAKGEVVDYGMVGDIDSVDGSVVTRLLDAGFLPVVSPISSDNLGPAAEHQFGHGRGRDRRRARRGEADSLHRRARHPRASRRSALADFVYRRRRAAPPARRRRALATACCPRRARSRRRFAAACVACTSSPTTPRMRCSPRSSRTKAPARSSLRTRKH